MNDQSSSEAKPPTLPRPPDHVQWIHHIMPFVAWMMVMQVLANAGPWNYAARGMLGLVALWYWKPWQFDYVAPALKHLLPGMGVGILVFAFWVVPETPWVTRQFPHAQNVYLTWFTQDVGAALTWSLQRVALGRGGLLSALPPLLLTGVLAALFRPWKRVFDPFSIVAYVIAAASWVVFLSPNGVNVPMLGSLFAPEAGEFPWVTIADATTDSIYDPAQCAWIWTLFRIAGSAFVISIIEEFFWRGWMYRWMVKEPFYRVSIGTLKWSAVIGAAVFFSLVHHRWLAAALCGICYGLLMIKSRNIWPSIIAHGVTNLLLGIYVVMADQYRFW